LPAHVVGEIIDGELHASTRPAAGDQVVRAEPFDVLALELAVLWAR